MKRPYDKKLGKITKQDREYADDLLCDLSNIDTLKESQRAVAEWFRKVRYEAVMADRKQRC